MKYVTFLPILFVLWAHIPVTAATENVVTIREEAGVTTPNYPIRIGRPFRQGEIPDYPQAVIEGTPVQTQADVKQRYPDGSVKHAILTFLIPELQARSTIRVTFRNQPSGLNEQRLSPADMLDPRFDFDAEMELTNGTTLTASARDMLQQGDFEYWLQGPVATSIILADHSVARQYDLGFDEQRSFRPIFHATFWPDINKVRIRFIGEIANTEAIQDQVYALRLWTGENARTPQYAKATLTHYAMSRWTKEFWGDGNPPPTISIDHNLAYLAETRFTPDYDPRKVIPEEEIVRQYGIWLTKDKDLYDQGWWQKAMWATGGRPDVGPYPTWTVQWLYTGDGRMQEIAFKQAELSGAWPIHVREGNPSKYLDQAQTVPGLGKVLSPSSRPTLKAGDWKNYNIKADDNIKIVGEFSNGGWDPDNAHVPDCCSPQYLLSGDYWFLEEMYFWTSRGVTSMIGYDTKAIWGRGPTGREGGIHGQVRALAWIFRNRIHTHFVAPDNDPVKAWIGTLIDDAIAVWEGSRQIAGTPYEETPCWQWGRKVYQAYDYGDRGLSPLHLWGLGTNSPSYVSANMVDPNLVERADAPWMTNFLILTLGRAEELGYPTTALKRWLGASLIGQLTDPGYDPYLAASYIIPTLRKGDREWFQSWTEIVNGFSENYRTDARARFQNNNGDAEHGYANIALAAASYLTDLPNGERAWAFMETNALPHPALTKNPKWAIIPR